MQLRYNKTIKNKVITLELQTSDFTKKEIQMIEQLGEPIVKFEKVYPGGHAVQFERRIMSGFRVRVNFNGSRNIEEAARAADAFFDDIVTVLTDKMYELEKSDFNMYFNSEQGAVPIKY